MEQKDYTILGDMKAIQTFMAKIRKCGFPAREINGIRNSDREEIIAWHKAYLNIRKYLDTESLPSETESILTMYRDYGFPLQKQKDGAPTIDKDEVESWRRGAEFWDWERQDPDDLILNMIKGTYRPLTEDEVNKYIEILKKTDELARFHFISRVAIYCEMYKQCKLQTGDGIAQRKADARRKLSVILRDCRRLSEELVETRHPFLPDTLAGNIFLDDHPNVPFSVDDKGELIANKDYLSTDDVPIEMACFDLSHARAHTLNQRFREDALALVAALSVFERSCAILCAAEGVKKKGRPNADALGVVETLAMFYEKYIGNPTGYESGPFAKCVEQTFIILNRISGRGAEEGRDVTRPVDQALKKRASIRKIQEEYKKRQDPLRGNVHGGPSPLK